MRSRWKGLFFAFGQSFPGTYNYRKLYASPALVGSRLPLHDGRRRLLIQVRENMVPHRLSLFFPTKRWGGAIHQRKKGKR